MIISNLTNENHLYHLKEIFHKASEITIISPFITKDPNLISFELLNDLKKLTIVTTLKAFDMDQYSKVFYFKTLYEKLVPKGIEVKVFIENSLHGKVFIADYSNENVSAIVTSANFTHNGLRLNNEWGIVVKDFPEILKIKNGIMGKVLHRDLNETFIDMCLKEIKGFPLPPKPNKKIELNLINLLEFKSNSQDISENATFWLKPIGVSENIISREQHFDIIEDELHFSKLRPKSVKPGDVLTCYAVGHQNILSVYVVTSGILMTNKKDDRWPYFVIGKNITPFYGKNWMKYNITVGNQKNEVLQNKLFNITPSGKNSYGSLMRGADKLKVTKEFGNYLLDKISSINKQLETT